MICYKGKLGPIKEEFMATSITNCFVMGSLSAVVPTFSFDFHVREQVVHRKFFNVCSWTDKRSTFANNGPRGGKPRTNWGTVYLEEARIRPMYANALPVSILRSPLQAGADPV